jgi:hypothetical protein
MPPGQQRRLAARAVLDLDAVTSLDPGAAARGGAAVVDLEPPELREGALAARPRAVEPVAHDDGGKKQKQNAGCQRC